MRWLRFDAVGPGFAAVSLCPWQSPARGMPLLPVDRTLTRVVILMRLLGSVWMVILIVVAMLTADPAPDAAILIGALVVGAAGTGIPCSPRGVDFSVRPGTWSSTVPSPCYWSRRDGSPGPTSSPAGIRPPGCSSSPAQPVSSTIMIGAVARCSPFSPRHGAGPHPIFREHPVSGGGCGGGVGLRGASGA